jgi:hypothetical protein
MNGTEAGQLRLAASYLVLRKAIGWIGTLLPVVLIAGEAAWRASPWRPRRTACRPR